MDGDDSATGTPKKALFRSVSWSVRSSPTNPNPNPTSATRPPPRPRSSLQPLSISRPPVLQAWPRPSSDDSGDLHPAPSTPAAAARQLDHHECSRVAGHLYLGSDAVARDRESLRRHGITHVLNCAGYTCPEYFKPELVYKTLWLQDSPAEDITSVLYDVFDYFEDVFAGGGRVLVHCSRGASRSASLAIAYLMWRNAQPFDDALRHVRAARGVTDPNLGFASQLLQCQKRVQAAPPSPGSSSSRIYRMAPHSPYDPLHLVPKTLDRTGLASLDSRGAFLVHVPSAAIYVWIGRECDLAMAESARAAACQVIRYEKARGPAISINDGSEPSDFLEALAQNAGVDGAPVGGKRRVESYDLDFEIYQKALRGGVVPPFPLFGSGSATRLPANGSGWGMVRQRFLKRSAREFISPADCCWDNKEEEAQSFRSPGSFSRDSLLTPDSSSSSSSSTLSTFSPASSVSDLYNSSPGSELPNLDPRLVSGLPFQMGNLGSPQSPHCSPSLAERRGGSAPSLAFLAQTDDNRRKVSRDPVRDWSRSISSVGVEEEDSLMDTQQTASPDIDRGSAGEGCVGKDRDFTEPLPHAGGMLGLEPTVRKEGETNQFQNHLYTFCGEEESG